MPGLERLPANRVLRVVANADAGELSLFLGAGASRSSGVPLASEMIEEWREMMYKDYEPGGADLKSWCKEQPWYEQADEYSVLFDHLNAGKQTCVYFSRDLG